MKQASAIVGCSLIKKEMCYRISVRLGVGRAFLIRTDENYIDLLTGKRCQGATTSKE